MRDDSGAPAKREDPGWPVHSTTQAPRIDGELDDPVWRATLPLTDFVSCADGQPTSFRTEVRLSYDETYLYFSYMMEEPLIHSSKLRASIRRHDGDVWQDDRAETFFWLEQGPGAGYYQLMVNMLNTTEDLRDENKAWNPQWTSAVKVDRDKRYWAVEARVPFAAFGRTMPARGASWRANFGRERYAAEDHYSWARITGTFHQKEAFHSITFWGPRESKPPAALSDLALQPGRYSGEVVLTWTAVGDDEQTGQAAAYDVRYASQAIAGEDDFGRASRVAAGPAPRPAGQAERFIVENLEPGQELYFAARAVDGSQNAGPVASAPAPIVVPGGPLSPAQLTIEPTLACAGIILGVSDAEELSALHAAYRPIGETRWQMAHPFTRVDRAHAATSLFSLRSGTGYELKLERAGRKSLNIFHTRPEFAIPEPLRVVEVHDQSALQQAVARARPGDEIRVHPGTYRGGLTIRRSGTAEHPIVLRGVVPSSEARRPAWQARGLPVIDGGGKAQSALLIEGSGRERLVSHVVLDHLQVRGGREVGVHLHWASWCVVQHCQVYDNGTYVNVHVNKGGPKGGRHLIQFNHIADLLHGRRSFTHEDQPDITYYGFKQDNYVGPGTILRGNHIEGHADGIQPSGDESDAPKVAETLSDVLSRWFNHSTDVYDNIVLDHSDDAVEADGVAVNLRLFRNQLVGCQNVISVSPSLPGPYFFLGNVGREYNESCVKLNTADGRGVIRNLYFYHNTFDRGKDRLNTDANGAIMTIWAGTPSKNIVFVNNVFLGHRALIDFQGLAHRPFMDYNLWYTSAGRGAFRDVETMFRRGGLKWEPHGIFADPQLLANLRPKPNSPVRDRGALIPGVNAAYAGAGPDIGALETR